MLGLARLRTSSLRWHSLLCRGLEFAVHPQVRVFPALSAVGWACCGGCGWGAGSGTLYVSGDEETAAVVGLEYQDSQNGAQNTSEQNQEWEGKVRDTIIPTPALAGRVTPLYHICVVY